MQNGSVLCYVDLFPGEHRLNSLLEFFMGLIARIMCGDNRGACKQLTDSSAGERRGIRPLLIKRLQIHVRVQVDSTALEHADRRQIRNMRIVERRAD